jgi:hypothetical protein
VKRPMPLERQSLTRRERSPEARHPHEILKPHL